jgi:hypothetical protein
MIEIIEIRDHIESEKLKKKEGEQKRVIKQLLNFLQCSSCRMKCSRCGSTVDLSTNYAFPPDSVFTFCASCEAEYIEYQRLKSSLEIKKAPWHNEEWKEMWDSWIEYQKALRRFRQSKEVRDSFKGSKK